jgi:hypothetical protein
MLIIATPMTEMYDIRQTLKAGSQFVLEELDILNDIFI